MHFVFEKIVAFVIFCGFRNGGFGWRPWQALELNHPFRKRPKKPDSKSKSTNSAAAIGRAGYWFPLKQAITAISLALAGDTIAQLRERWTKREPLNSDSNALTEVSGNSKLLLFLCFPPLFFCFVVFGC